MFGSSKISESPRPQKSGLQMEKYSNKFHDITGNGGSFTSPKVTSTPIRLDLYATPPKPHLLSPRRYSLSDIATPPRITKRDSINRSSFKHNISGPLLASTKLNVNVSTYEETKSPGLARRIVQYNQETEREKERHRPPTHQAKYGSPGLFPIVHLFKKSPPSLEQRPKRVKIRISSPGYSRHQSEEYKLKLLEGVVRPRTLNTFVHGSHHHSAEASTSTRSVLDALKEISRKRIHASEEFDVNEDSGKRQRTDFINGMDSNKRIRDDTSPLMDSPTSPSKPIPKRACMYDEYAASCSSTVHSVKKSDLLGSKRKSISTSTLTENPKETKQVKLINVETQTVTEEKDTLSEKPKASADELEKSTEGLKENAQNDDDNTPKKRESPLKVFDDAPLERIRKNRLAALMGSLTGKDPVLTPKPTFSSILNGTADKSTVPNSQNDSNESGIGGKPLVPILVTNKTPTKSEKHVHFNIPEKTDSESSSSTGTTVFNTVPTLNTSTVVTPVSLSQSSDKEIPASTPAPPSSPVNLNPPEPATSSFGFGTNSASLPAPEKTNSFASIPFSAPSTSSTPQFSFGLTSPKSSAAVPLTSTPSVTSSSKPGGFKFNLSPSKPEKPVVATTSSVPVVGTPPKPIQLGFGFGVSTSAPTKPTVVVAATTSTGLTFGTTTTASSSGPVSSSSASPFKFGGFNSESSNNKPHVGIASVISKSEMTTPSTFSFGKITTTAALSGTSFTSTTQASKAPTFSFGAVKSTSSATPTTSTFSFSNAKPVAATTVSASVANPAFGALSNSAGPPASAPTNVFGNTSGGFGNPSPNFGSSTVQSGFGAPNPATGGFGTESPSFGGGISSANAFTAPTTSAGVFGVATTSTSGFAAPVQPSSFGTTSFGPTTSTAPSFGPANSSSGFGFKTPSTTPGGFGAPETTRGGFGASSIFSGNKSVPSFSTPVTTTSAGFSTASPFSNTNASGFGQNNVSSPFGASSASASAFGTSNTTTSPSSVFGVTGGFGTPANTSSANVFGGTVTTQASGFGTANSIFSTTTTVGPFGNAATTTTASFGASTTSAFSFGAKTSAPSSNGFGSTPAPTFGNKSNTFGGSSSSFGSTNSFGTSSTPSFAAAATTQASGGFGSTSGGFGTQAPAFGENKSLFGTTTTPSFGTNSPASGSFAPSASFGTPNTNPPAFGATANNAGFAKPSNNFGTAAPNNFASPSGGGFGSNQAATGPFGNPGAAAAGGNSAAVFNFGSGATAKPGVFSFGNASASGDTAKSSFNFSGGSGAPAFGASSTFGGAAAPAFGAAAAPQFGAQSNTAAPGMFNIGSGSPSTRNRTLIRAKRRT